MISKPRLRALKILHDIGDCTSRDVARRMWPDSWEKTSKQGVHGQWLPGRAARMLHAMASDGLVFNHYPRRHSGIRWSIAPEGSRVLEVCDAQ